MSAGGGPDGQGEAGVGAPVELTVELTVDTGVCVGVGQCEALASAVFRVNDDGVAEVLAPGRLPAALARQVIEACPSGAIRAV